MNFIVIGYYTSGTPYEQEAQGLIKSCANFGIPCDVRGYPSRGSWSANTNMKPEVILDFMLAHPYKNLVYIDVDGIVQQYPALFDTITEDLAVHMRNGSELLSGTIFIRNTDKMQLFIKCWINIISNHPELNDQQALHQTLKRHARQQGISVYFLPPTYTQIYDLMRDSGRPVIEHFQASRRFKKAVLQERIAESAVSKIPKTVLGMATREAGDGSFTVPRMSRIVCDLLEKDFVRFPNENRWYPKQTPTGNLSELRRYFLEHNCYIVGKGPSLDLLSAADFTDPSAPVICINESIHKVEELGLPNKTFVMQQDAWLKATCRPKNAGVLVTHACKYWYPDSPERYVFGFRDLNMTGNNITVTYALSMAKMYGATGFKMMCFDACVGHSQAYAKCIGYESTTGGSLARFNSHRTTIERYANPLHVEFIIPK